MYLCCPKGHMKSSLQLFRKEVVYNLHKQGISQIKISQAVNMTQGRVSQIIKQINDHRGEIIPADYRGAPTKLSSKQEDELMSIIDQGAIESGFEGEIWTSKRLIVIIKREWGRDYHPHHIPKLLRRLGYSLQKPKKVDVRKDQSKVEQWRSKKIKEIKKGLKKKML